MIPVRWFGFWMFWILLLGSWRGAPWGNPLERARSARGIAVVLRGDFIEPVQLPTQLSAEMRAATHAGEWSWMDWKDRLLREPSWKSLELHTAPWKSELVPAGGSESWIASLPEIFSASLTWNLGLSTAAFVLMARLFRVWLWCVCWFAGLRLLEGFSRLGLLMQALAWAEVWALYQGTHSGWLDWTFAVVPLGIGICVRAILQSEPLARVGWVILAAVAPWVRPEYAVGAWMAAPGLLDERRGRFFVALAAMGFGVGAYFQWPEAQFALARELRPDPLWLGWVAKGFLLLACVRPFGAREIDFSARAMMGFLLLAGYFLSAAGQSTSIQLTQILGLGLARPIALALVLAWPLVLPVPRSIWWIVTTAGMVWVGVTLRGAAG